MKCFSPKFRKLPKQEKVRCFLLFVDSHKVLVNGWMVTRCNYMQGDDAIMFSSSSGSIIMVQTESLFAAKIDGHVISGVDEFGKFKIEFFNLTPASITL